MKDIEKLENLLNEWGVPFAVEHTTTETYILVGEHEFGIDSHPKVEGYMGFYTRWVFTSEGDFIKMGAWE